MTLTAEEMRDNYDWFQKIAKDRYVKKEIEELDKLKCELEELKKELEHAKHEVEASFDLKYDMVKDCYAVKDAKDIKEKTHMRLLEEMLIEEHEEYRRVHEELVKVVNDEYLRRQKV